MNAAFDSPPRLAVRTVELRDRRGLLTHLPAAAPLCWLRSGEGLVGWGQAARIELPAEEDPRGTSRFTEGARRLAELFAEAAVDDPVDLPGTGPVAFGAFTFDPRSSGSALVVPSVVVGRRDGRTWLTTIGGHRVGAHPAELSAPRTPLRPVGPLIWGEGALSAQAWGGAVAEAVRRIRGGALHKAVLARDLVADAERGIDPRTLLDRLAGGYPDCFTFSIDGMLGATPELLLRRFDGRLSSLVLAGTRPRGADPAEDARLAAELQGSAKDLEEHAYAIDSLRRTLAPIAERVEAPERPGLLRLANVQHLASPASAELRPGVSSLDAVAALHPTAAVGGTPTPEAVELIRELERMDRGRYAGPVGWVDARDRGEWGIALRCAEVSGSRARLFAGCGIVADSDPAAETAEADAKFRVIREALTD
ncbi:isochorismate synthase [Nocardiopsis composta]|uniref:isochorismate synthase n=1 Tax=Nocardiopsis composta TaxID=157465 RepID=A0A7W8QK95_9ACTN|nr:isochorismate synthase [Nocardiopsis composta]MBB5431549.1 menaquinone-specific isochorismate synthase [Nocardiopsis composta]